MTLEYNANEDYHYFKLTQKELVDCINGKPIKHISGNKEYEETVFTLTFKGKKRAEVSNKK